MSDRLTDKAERDVGRSGSYCVQKQKLIRLCFRPFFFTLAPGLQVGSSAPPRGIIARPISGLPRATGGRTLSVRFPSEASARGPQLPSPFGHPTSKLSLSLRPVQPPSCKKLKSDSQLPPSHQPVPLPRSAPSQAARMDCRGLGCCVRRGG